MSKSIEQESADKYLSGDYQSLHPNWHAEDSPLKVQDISGVLESAIRDWRIYHKSMNFEIADVGAGAGLVLKQVGAVLTSANPDLCFARTAYEISPHAAALARSNGPDSIVHERYIASNEARFDLALLIDVLEHVENPWKLLRTVHTNSKYMIVRQPLLGNFSRFRHNDYAWQRKHWGHITCFNKRSFLDMADACGWEPVFVELKAPWELAGAGKSRWINRAIAKIYPEVASFFIDGFYLMAAFRAH